ncbi:tetratricopeptide repeat protein [Novosphingobium sp. TH158]|uniref:tetratricopeptide repeat protein n=1 Tax=Novosphingobium sp. TH158 TaxID=2067455 RepID=UPI0013044FB2|nr:tetratricopeptide repeat protein [Novosphingobium sp. TH158]
MALRPDNSKTPAISREDAQQEGFLREVDEALREQEALDLVKRWGKLIGWAVFLGLGALAAWLGWNYYRDQGREQRSEEYVKALDQLEAGRLDEASKLLAPLAKEGGDGSQAAARLLQAGIALEQGKADAATKIFAEVAADDSAPQAYRDLARIREVALRFDSMPADQVVAAMKPFAQPGNPWFGSAGELLGLAYMKQGKNDLAGPVFASIARDKAVPDTLRRRARQMAGYLGVDAVDDVNEAVKDVTAANAPEQGQ